jgi:hypothetical protein
MFTQWVENLRLLIGAVDELPALSDLKRLFESGYSELDAWAMLAGEYVYVD